MILRHSLPFLSAIAITTTVTLAAPAPTNNQIEQFTQALKTAWEADDTASLSQLVATDGIPEATRDRTIGYWQEIRKRSGKRIDHVRIRPIPRDLKNLSPEEREMISERTVDGRRYIIKPEASGIASIATGGQTSLSPVLISQGALKLAEHQPASGGNAREYQLPAPIPAPGEATQPPGEKEVDDLRKAVEEACKAKDLSILSYGEGAPRDLRDSDNAVDNQILDLKSRIFSSVEFIPLSRLKSDPKHKRLVDIIPPQQWGDRWYAHNLPIVGAVTITVTSADVRRGDTESITRLVGITPKGELRLPVMTPVHPPQ